MKMPWPFWELVTKRCHLSWMPASSQCVLAAAPMRHLQIVGKEPPGGHGDGNDSTCRTCGCPREKLEQNSTMKTVCPMVPQHQFFKMRKDNRMKFRKLFFFFGLGAGAGAGAAWVFRERDRLFPKKKDRSGRVSVSEQQESPVQSAADSEEESL